MGVEIKWGSLPVAINIIQFIVFLMFLSLNESSPRCYGGCCADYYMDYSRNDCIPCEKGYFGLNCSFRCPSLYYGLRCHLKCNCSHDLCHHQRGCVHFSTTFELKSEENFKQDVKLNTDQAALFKSTISAFDLKYEDNIKQDDVNKLKRPCDPKYKKKWTKTKESIITATIFLLGFAIFLFGAYLKTCKKFQEKRTTINLT